MWDVNKAANEITRDDIGALFRDQYPESEILEYKRQPYGNNDSEKNELCKDITAFANASGGFIIIGIEEVDGKPSKPVPFNKADIFIESMRATIYANIEPRLNSISFGKVEWDATDTSLVVIKVPIENKKPYMVKRSKNSVGFYTRYNTSNMLMNHDQIKTSFLGDSMALQISELKAMISSLMDSTTIPATANSHTVAPRKLSDTSIFVQTAEELKNLHLRDLDDDTTI